MPGNAICHPAGGNDDVAIACGNTKAFGHVGHLLGKGVVDFLGVHVVALSARLLVRA